MSFREVLAELPSLTFDQRQLLVRRAMELDDQITGTDEALVEKRLAEHRRDPSSALSLEEMEARVRSRAQK
jgi:hypothetical protein